MKRKDIEKQIKTEFQQLQINNNKEELLKAIQDIEIEDKQPSKRPWFKLKRMQTLALACCVILAFVLFRPQVEKDYFVSFDVNPYIELEVSKNRRVEDVICHNDDATIVMDDMDLKDTDLDVAVNAIIGSMFRHGYISDVNNSILVTILGEDQQVREELKENVSTHVKEILSGYSIEASVVSQDLAYSKDKEALANQYNISVGKVTLIQELMKSNPDYRFEDLTHLSINDLNTLVHYANMEFKSITVDGVESHRGYVTSDEVKVKVLEHANVSESSVLDYTYDISCEDSQLIYSVNFSDEYGKYHYSVNAISGDIISVKAER